MIQIYSMGWLLAWVLISLHFLWCWQEIKIVQTSTVLPRSFLICSAAAGQVAHWKCAASINYWSASFYPSDTIHKTSSRCFLQADDSRETFEMRSRHTVPAEREIYGVDESAKVNLVNSDGRSSFLCLKHHCSECHMETWWERRVLSNCRIAPYSIPCSYYHFVSWRSTDITQILPGITWTSQCLNNIHMNFNKSTELLSNLLWLHQFCFWMNCSFEIIAPSGLDLCRKHTALLLSMSQLKRQVQPQAKYKWVIWERETTSK